MKPTSGEKIFYFFNTALLILLAALCILPIINVFALSFSSADAITSGQVSVWPVGFNIDTYKKMFYGTRVMLGFRNSIEITLVSTCLSMIFTIICAYPLSRKHFPGRKYVMLAIIFTMLFSGGIIPNYLLVKNLGLMNNFGSLWLPGLISTYNMMVMKSYFENIPIELDEAARIDGCGEWRMLINVILPTSKPVLATIALFYAVGSWNSFFNVLMYITDANRQNLSVIVQNMLQNQKLTSELQVLEDQVQLTEEGVKACAVIVMMVPMMLVYPFLQKYFIKGVMLGAVKG